MAALAEEAELIPGLKLQRVLGRGAHSVVWAVTATRREMPGADGESLVLKLALDGAEEHGALLRHEARFLARMDSPAVVKLYEAGTTNDGREYLLLRHFRQGSLADRLEQGPLPIAQALAIVQDICGGLHEAHRRGVIHRDVKPGNILLDESSAGACLSDFGLAQDLTLQESGAGQVRIAGSFLYSAPEQTGMLRREVDGRADLYALGCVLFECLAGKPPFQGSEAETLLQLHATARPVDVRVLRSEVSETLARVVDKLLSKDPDDRYSTAKSLAADLKELAADRPLPTLGLQHRTRTATVGAPLVGRETELAELATAIRAAGRKHGRALWIEGESGVGKDRLCRAALSGAPHVVALWARNREQDGSSFAASRQLMQQLLRHAKEEAHLAELVATVLETEGPALARLFPGLAGLPPPAPDLELEAAIEAFVRTLAGCTTSERPLAVVFEDAGELSPTDLTVVQRLLAQHREAGFLLWCTGSRYTHVGTDVSFGRLRLEPLPSPGVERLLRHWLGPRAYPDRLAQATLQSTGGNPRRLSVHIAHALARGIVETDGRTWRFDEQAFVALDLPGITRPSAETVISRLSEGAILPLRAAALLGRRFEARWLELAGYPRAEVDRSLWEAVQLRLVASTDDGTATFVDPSSQEKLRAALTDDDRLRIYGALVQGLAAESSHEQRTAALLARASYATSAAPSAKRDREFCLEAGLNALDAFDFPEAHILLGYAEELSTRYALAPDFRLMRALGQLEAQVGHVEAAVAKLLEAIAACPDAMTRAAMHVRCAELRFFNEAGHTTPMLAHLEQGWHELGRRMPGRGPLQILPAIWFAFLAFMIELTGIGAGTQRASEETRTRVRLCEFTGIYYFWLQDLGATLRATAYGWLAARRIERSKELSHGLAGLANVFYIVGNRRRADRYYAEAYAITRQFRDAPGHAYVRYMHGVGLSLYGDIQPGERILSQAVEQHAGDLEIGYIGQGTMNLAFSYLMRGYVHRAAQLLGRLSGIVQARLGPDAEIPETSLSAQVEVLHELARLDLTEPMMERMTKRALDPHWDPMSWTLRWHGQAHYRYLRGADDAQIDEAVRQAHRSRLTPRGAAWLIARSHLTVAFIRLEQFHRAPPERREERKRMFLESARRARLAPRGPYLNGNLHLLRAAEHWILGDHAKAEQQLAKAEQEAAQHDFPVVLVDARVLRARMLLALGKDEAASSEACGAVTLADRIGHLRKAREIERTFSLARASLASTTDASTSSRSATAPQHAQRERDVLLEVTLAASREIEPEAQARAVLDRLIGLLGAERGLIFAGGRPGELVRLAGRAAGKEDLDDEAKYAESLVRRVYSTGVPIVMSGTEEGASLGSESVVAANLRSMVCAPIRLAEQIHGVLYLDSSLARGVFTRRDLEILEAIGGQIALTQEMARAARLEIERRDLDRDLQLSGAVQSLLLPAERDLSHGRIRLSAAYTPVSHSGGDFWTYKVLPDGRLWVLLADATGHGAGAAMVTALLAGSYRTLVDREATDLRTLLTDLNRSLTNLCAGRHSATLIALEINAEATSLRIFGAGAPPVLLLRPGESVEPLLVRGAPLGGETLMLGEAQVALSADTRVLLVTDGILEMQTQQGRELGARRLNRIFSNAGAAKIPAARDAIMREIEAAGAGCVMEDDLTMLLIGIEKS